ncbi:UNVERIFIED_CONTAM: Potassium voltage-gated channel subfamily D member 1 [Gekko kuhli]
MWRVLLQNICAGVHGSAVNTNETAHADAVVEFAAGQPVFKFRSRSSLNAKTHDNLKLNCDATDFTAAIICIPTPPANTPDESRPPSPGGPGGPLRNSSLSTPYILHETVKISSL